jgi:hypothetical protein
MRQLPHPLRTINIPTDDVRDYPALRMSPFTYSIRIASLSYVPIPLIRVGKRDRIDQRMNMAHVS